MPTEDGKLTVGVLLPSENGAHLPPSPHLIDTKGNRYGKLC